MSSFTTPRLPLASQPAPSMVSRLESFGKLWWLNIFFLPFSLTMSCWSSWDMNPIEKNLWINMNEWKAFKIFPRRCHTSHRWRGRPWGRWQPPLSVCCYWSWLPSPSCPRAASPPDPSWWSPVAAGVRLASSDDVIFDGNGHDVMLAEDVSWPGSWHLASNYVGLLRRASCHLYIIIHPHLYWNRWLCSKHKLDRGSIRSSPIYGLSTPYGLTKEQYWT